MAKGSTENADDDLLMADLEQLFGSENVFHQYFQNQQIDEALKYNLKGRRYLDCSLESLNYAWIQIVTEIADNNWTHLDAQVDIESELLLRQKHPPYSQVSEQIKRIEATIENLSAAVKQDPSLTRQIRAVVQSGVSAYNKKPKSIS